MMTETANDFQLDFVVFQLKHTQFRELECYWLERKR